MKNSVVYSLVILLSVFVSCKEDTKQGIEDSSVESIVEPKQDTVFTVTLNATVLKDDSFQIYFKSNDEDIYDEKNSIFTEMKGSEVPQDIVFRFPDGVFPDNIRLDFGTNKEQSEIKINSFKMSFYDKNFEITGSDFFNYMLVESNTAAFDKDKATIKPKLIDDVYDPQSTSEKALYDQIQLIIK